MSNQHEGIHFSNPRAEQWFNEFKERHEARPTSRSLPDQIIIDGLIPENSEPDNLKQLFFQTMCQGVATDDEGNTHFFHPKSFLSRAGLEIRRYQARLTDFANGLDAISKARNLPGNQDDSALQQSARVAMDEYLDPDLFQSRYTDDSELIEIYAALDPATRQDQMVNDALIASDHQRTIRKMRHRAEAAERAVQAATKNSSEHDSQSLNPYRPRSWDGATFNQVRTALEKTHSRVALERVNAVEKWRDFITQNIPDANLEEEIISFKENPRFSTQYPHIPSYDTYAIIAFNFAGHRCMIAECCNPDGEHPATAAAKLWRGKPDDKHGWKHAFAHTKFEAAKKGLTKDLRHIDLAPEVDAHSSNNPEDHIVEAEDRLFRVAMHYFETGELLGGGKTAANKLDRSIGPEFRRPNPDPTTVAKN